MSSREIQAVGGPPCDGESFAKSPWGDAPAVGDREGRVEREVLARDVRRLREKCEDAEIEIARLRKQLAQVHNTLSFRLGYALIESTKSFGALRALPRLMVQLRRDAKERAKGRAKHGRPGM